MSENRLEILTGAAVLVIAAGFLLFAGEGHSLRPAADSYTLHASFRSVEGVSVGTDVKLAGVKVGTITALTLNPKTFFADATLALRNDIELPDDSAILISSEGLLGGNFVELQPGGSLDNFAPGDEIEDTQGAISMVSMMMKFVDGGSSSSAPAAPAAAAPAAAAPAAAAPVAAPAAEAPAATPAATPGAIPYAPAPGVTP
jgi:phospholipid/cholesterol/gamma-HCH transport system substrate-binding protein